MEPAIDVFSGHRLRVARAFAGLTQAQLGDQVSVSHAFVGYLETGHKQPTAILVDALAQACGFLPSFFFGPPLDEYRDDECHFRKRQTTPVGARNRALSHGTLFGQLVGKLDGEVSLPPRRVPATVATSPEEIERAADRCRLEWGLGGDRPIHSVTRALENAGVVVTVFTAQSEKVDAFSRSGARPVIVLSDDKGSASRRRFDIAHEAGHLVMHVGLPTGDVARENEANAFASALLLPRPSMVREFPRRSRLDVRDLLPMKERFGVSVAALVRRAYDLRLIDAVQYQRAYKQMSALGWRKGEPNEVAPETPEIVPLAVAQIEKQGTSIAELARSFGWSAATFERVSGIRVPEPAIEPLVDNVISFKRKKSTTPRPVRPQT